MRKLKVHRFKFIGLGSCALVLIASMQNCSNINIEPIPQERVINSVADPIDPPPRLEPVLAVRNTACVMCHAQINGDLISDFGQGNPFVMGTDAVANHQIQKDYYSPFNSKHFVWGGTMWRDSSVMGNVYVPTAQIKDQRLIAAYANPLTGNAMPSMLSILDFVKSKFVNPSVSTTAATELMIKTTNPDINVPGLRGKYIGKKSIWIDSPTEDEVRGMMQAPGAAIVSYNLGAVLAKNSSADQIKNLIVVKSTNNQKNYFMNNGVLTCKGDIIIDGVVFLKDLILNTDNGGCRLYVTGSVFIQGPVIYTNEGESNLQISSARAIVFGIKTLTQRFTQSYTSAMFSGMRNAPNDQAEATAGQLVIADGFTVDRLTNDFGAFSLMLNKQGQVIATMDDYDTQNWKAEPGVMSIPNYTTCVGIGSDEEAANNNCSIITSGSSVKYSKKYRREVNYEHLALNAPKIHSRYYGVFKGVIIGEDVLFSVNHFIFDKDPVMFDIDMFPLLRERIFKMED